MELTATTTTSNYGEHVWYEIIPNRSHPIYEGKKHRHIGVDSALLYLHRKGIDVNSEFGQDIQFGTIKRQNIDTPSKC